MRGWRLEFVVKPECIQLLEEKLQALRIERDSCQRALEVIVENRNACAAMPGSSGAIAASVVLDRLQAIDRRLHAVGRLAARAQGDLYAFPQA